jgi:hypothetical protein
VRVSVWVHAEVKKVYTLVRPQTLKWQTINGLQAQFVVPRIEEYEVGVLEKNNA